MMIDDEDVEPGGGSLGKRQMRIRPAIYGYDDARPLHRADAAGPRRLGHSLRKAIRHVNPRAAPDRGKNGPAGPRMSRHRRRSRRKLRSSRPRAGRERAGPPRHPCRANVKGQGAGCADAARETFVHGRSRCRAEQVAGRQFPAMPVARRAPAPRERRPPSAASDGRKPSVLPLKTFRRPRAVHLEPSHRANGASSLAREVVTRFDVAHGAGFGPHYHRMR